jgi:hypothetical protein
MQHSNKSTLLKCRGESVECDDERNGGRCHHLVGEEDAIWLLRLVLPYVNEVLLNLRCLFSGEPATTMKVKKKLPLVVYSS